MKGKGEKERYTHLNAEFQRIAGRDKRAFLIDQCKEIEDNNRMGKTRDLFRKSRKSQPILKISDKNDNPGDLPGMEGGFTNGSPLNSYFP